MARPWPWVSWWYSALLAVPLVIVGIIAINGASADQARIGFSVTDMRTGSQIAGAELSSGESLATSAADGSAWFDAALGSTEFVVEAPGYHPLRVSSPLDSSDLTEVTLEPSTVSGVVTDATSGEPLAGASISVIGQDATEPMTSGPGGEYTLQNVPSGASLVVSADGYAPVEAVIGADGRLDATLRFARVSGTVNDADGVPITGAIVSAGGVQTTTQRDGTFAIDDAGDAVELDVFAPGFEDATIAIAPERTATVSLQELLIRAAYINQFGLVDENTVDNLVAMIERTELNALVIDIKQDTIYYDTQVEFFRNVPGMVVPLYDPAALIAELQAQGIYTIARLVVFQDPLVAEHYPELAVTDDVTGGLWRSWDEIAWVNAFNEELWDANIELALEAADLGFDEIQYDYVRFPSDGDLSTANFGPDYSQEAREGAITGFIQRSSEAIRPTGAKLGVDIFGFVTIRDDDQGIGQRFNQIAPLVDYLCMMIYPSHYETGNIESAPGHPNDYPYETIYESLERAAVMAPDHVAKFRPWLQDFSYPVAGLRDYTPEDVRAQIDAAEDFGASGWMLWNPTNVPTEEALRPA